MVILTELSNLSILSSVVDLDISSRTLLFSPSFMNLLSSSLAANVPKSSASFIALVNFVIASQAIPRLPKVIVIVIYM